MPLALRNLPSTASDHEQPPLLAQWPTQGQGVTTPESMWPRKTAPRSDLVLLRDQLEEMRQCLVPGNTIDHPVADLFLSTSLEPPAETTSTPSKPKKPRHQASVLKRPQISPFEEFHGADNCRSTFEEGLDQGKGTSMVPRRPLSASQTLPGPGNCNYLLPFFFHFQ